MVRRSAVGYIEDPPQPLFERGLDKCLRSIQVPRMAQSSNVLGSGLEPCSFDPMTGYYRDGCCHTGPGDMGLHTVCAEMTAEFLAFSAARGNDLSTPHPEYDFPGLKPGDRWCLCVERWHEAHEAGVAPKVHLEATHISALEYVSLEDLQAHSVD